MKTRPWPRLVLLALVIASPAIVTSALLFVLSRATLLDHFSVWNDEIAYQHQIATFVRAGFGGGYYTSDEQTPQLSGTHFSVHGPGFPVIYGSLGRLLGWQQHSGPLFNLSLLAIATAIFLWMARASHWQIAATGLVLITSWWVLIMAPLTMQESLHQSVMIIMAAFAARLLHPDTHRHGVLLAVALLILAVASVLRPTNWIVAVPLVAVALARRPLLAAVATLVTAAGIPAFWLLWRYLSAPIPDLSIELNEIAGSQGPAVILQRLLQQLPENLSAIFDPAAFLQRPFDQHVMFEATALAGVFGALVVVTAATAFVRRARKDAVPLGSLSFKVDLFNALALGIPLAAILGLYYEVGSSISRVTAPFVLLALLVLAGTASRSWILLAAVAAQLFVAPSFVSKYREWLVPGYTYNRSTAEQFQREISSLMPFAAGQGPWCNTLLTNTYPPEIAFVPAGIGLTVGYNAEDLAMPVKSKYFLLARKDAGPYGNQARLVQMGTTAIGSLYLNLDSACR
jgi:hypothetical protein